jgi:hypothetical protein
LEKAWYWWDKAIAIVGEEKVAERALLPDEKWPPRPGNEPPSLPSGKREKTPVTDVHEEHEKAQDSEKGGTTGSEPKHIKKKPESN